MNQNDNLVDFISIKKKGYYEYHLPIDQICGLVHTDLCDGSIINYTSKTFKYYESLGITCGALGTDSLWYATFIELLLKDKNNFIIGSDLSVIGQSNVPIECYWNYMLEQTSENHPNLCKNLGFLSRTEYDKTVYNSIPEDSLAYKACYDSHQYLKICNKNSSDFLKTFDSEMSIWSFFIDVNNENKFIALIQNDRYKQTNYL